MGDNSEELFNKQIFRSPPNSQGVSKVLILQSKGILIGTRDTQGILTAFILIEAPISEFAQKTSGRDS